jgi:hypothetical protein
MSADILNAALDYAKRGLRVFPVWPVVATDSGHICGCGRLSCSSPGKHPHPRLVPNGRDGASADEARVRYWWESVPNANIGVATGDVVVLDVDGEEGLDSLQRLEAERVALPPTWRASTGNGRHFYFKRPLGKEIRNSVGKLARGIDIRSLGGYVIAPPSKHICGRTYAWLVDHHPEDVPLAPMPDWLVTIASQPPSSSSPARDASIWRDLVANGASQGARNDSIAKLSGHLLRRYVDPTVTHELMQLLNGSRFRPPLEEEEVTNIVASVARKELRRRESRDGSR